MAEDGSRKDGAAGALAGLKVVDLSRVLGGPYCTQILGDHGAEVIKIEPPEGDETRGWGPPFEDGTASYFIGVNRNKRALTLDLKQPAAREILLRILAEADVLVENFKTGTLEKWGLGYADLERRFPRLVHCRISGFGADGPLGGLPGYDACVQALSGLMSINGKPGDEPLRIGMPAVDIVTGLYATIGIAFALRERERSGRGQFVEAALFDCALSILHPHAANFFLNGRIPAPTGNAHPNIAPYETVETGRGDVFLAVGNDGQFARLAAAIGEAGLAEDPRFATNAARLANREALRTALARAFARHEAEPLAQRLMREGVPAAAIVDVGQALANPHTAHRGMVVEMGTYRGIGSPVKMSRTSASLRRPPPVPDRDRAAILAEHGFDAADPEIDRATRSRRR